ncbi:hypothetical protein LTR94_028881, partial [Friedmanniomyces endolithicus]
MFETARQLDFQAAHQRHVHVRADHRHRQFDESRRDGAAPAGIRRRAGADQVGPQLPPRHAVGEGDRAVDARVAVIQLRFAAHLRAERDAQIAARQRQQVRARRLQIGQRQRRLAEARRLDADRIQRRGIAQRRVRAAGIGQVAAVKRIIGIGRGQAQLALERRRADAVRRVAYRRLRIERRAFPAEAQPFPAQPGQRAPLVVLHMHQIGAGICDI